MRTMLRGKVTVLIMMLGMLLAVPTVALAADLLTEAELSSDVNARTEVASNDTTDFNIKVWARGNLPSSQTGNSSIVNAYTMGSDGTITPNSSSTTAVNFRNGHNYGVDGQTCPATVPTQATGVTGKGCAGDPFIVPATLTVGDVDGGTEGTLTVGATGSPGLGITSPASCTTSDSDIIAPNTTADATDCSRDQGFVEVVDPNQAPTKPGTPSGTTPNQGAFTLNWGASTDDGNPDPPKAVTYRLEHQDANDAGYSLVSGAGTLSTNSFSFTNASPEAEGTWTYQVQASDSALTSAFSDASSEIKVDRTAPSAPVVTTTPGSPVFDGWFKDTVTVTYSGSTDGNLPDGSAGSGVASPSGYSGPNTFDTSGTHNYSGTATDGAGNVSDPITGSVKVDADDPTFGPCQGGPFLVNSGSHEVSITATDDHSGMDNAGSTLSDSVNTTSTGTQTVTFTAKDNVGHSVTKDCDYTVRAYDFVGFTSPVDNPTVLNTVKAGQAVPLKWRLMDGTNPVTNLQSVTVTASALTCSLGTSADLLEEVASGSSGLQNLGNGYYQYNWKTPTSYAKSCKKLQINGEGMQLTATQQPLFQFTK